MSDMEKAIEQKLADARKQSEKKEEAKQGDKKEAKCSDKKSDQKKPTNSDSRNNPNAKTSKGDDTNKDTKAKDGEKKSDSGTSKRQDSKGDSDKKDGNTGGGKELEKNDKKLDTKAKDGQKKPDPGPDKKQDSKGSSDKKDGNTGGGKDTEKNDKKSGSTKVEKESDKTSNGKASTSENKKPAASSKTKSEDSTSKADEKKNESDKSRHTSRSRTSRDKSRSPIRAPFKRNYYYKDKFEQRTSFRGGRSPTRRKSRSPSRRRSRSPVRRRSPSPSRRRDSWRRSPRRRSRSPYDRTRSPTRSHRGRSRSRSSERVDPKALIAKKSFLDDLAVKFAQEGKEFPELEQYRCEINSQFITYPHAQQFSRNAVEHVCNSMPGPGPFMDSMAPMNVSMSNPIVMTDPYNAYPMYPETPSLISYPLQEAQPLLISPGLALDSPQPPTVPQPVKTEKTSVAKSTIQKQVAGTQPSKTSEIWTKQEVKIRIKQALQLLDDADRSITKTGKFMFRAPTYYGNDVNENRSPIVQSANNPLFAFSHRSGGAASDPFGNVPTKLKAVVDVLRMDEGLISQKIYQRHQEKQHAADIEREKLETEERTRRLQNIPISKTSLQKTTQTDPTVCTDCLLRKIKVRYNEETQTDIVRTVDSDAQTNPMPVQTVSEFGSITELTPNQVRAVSELIKYIKLTVTSGNLQEMRDSLKEDQVYNLNGDLRTAYHYFDAMVEHQNLGGAQNVIIDEVESFEQPDDYEEADTLIEDENVNEYDEFHRAFCPDDDEQDGEAEVYANPLLQGQPSSFQRTMDNRNSYLNNRGNKSSFGNTGGNFGRPSRGQFNPQQARGGGRGSRRGAYAGPFNRRN